jgi:hypothetical protein
MYTTFRQMPAVICPKGIALQSITCFLHPMPGLSLVAANKLTNIYINNFKGIGFY